MRKESGYPYKTAYDTERFWLSTQFGVIYGNHLPIHLNLDRYTENFRLLIKLARYSLVVFALSGFG